MTTDPHAPGEVTITVKVPESKKFAGDAPWFVFRGSVEAVKAQIGATFGITTEGLTLSDVTINAQRLATGLHGAAQGLGGTVISSGPAETQQPAEQAPASSGGDVWQQAAAAQTDPPWNTDQQQAAAPAEEKDPLLVNIENCKTIPELQQLWAENQAAFNDSKYMDAYRAKGKSLS